MAANVTRGQRTRHVAGARAGAPRPRALRLVLTLAVIAGSTAVLTASPAGASTARASTAGASALARAQAPRKSAPHLWRPQAFSSTPAPSPAAGPAATSGGNWRVEPTPNPAHRPNGSLLGESCSSAHACTAVGDYIDNAGVIVTLAERWNGTGWAIQPTPNPAGATSSQLTAVSCASADACTAAGYYTDAAGVLLTLAEAWNGTSWHVQPTPNPAGALVNAFFGISCGPAGTCTAVGEDIGLSGVSLTLAERWNGTGWQIQHTPNPAGATDSGLFAVSCAARNACIAVGASATSSGATVTLAEAWNGASWHIQATPDPAGADISDLQAVSCPSPYGCTAVGYYLTSTGASMTLAERWNGTHWRIQPTPVPAGAAASELGAVSCATPGTCTAVGAQFSSATRLITALAEVWHGSGWTIQPTPNPAGAQVSELTAVSCTSPGTCDSAGVYASRAGTPLPLAEGRTGMAWKLQAAASPTGTKFSELEAVSCLPAGECMAVGNYSKTYAVSVTLAEIWNGTRWRILPTPNPAGATGSYLQGVSCTSASACTAAGFYYRKAKGPFPLAEAWNGTTWTIQDVPAPAGATNTRLYAVSCTSASACTAVGSYSNRAEPPAALAERWNGHSWRIQTSATPAGFSVLSGVSCTSPGACIAVGYGANSSGEGQPLAEAWNGAAWHAQKVPLPAHSAGGVLAAVSCASPYACTATGTAFNSTGPSLAERWNGTSWHVQPAPNPPDWQASTGEVTLAAVACPSAGACVAVGDYSPGNQPETYAEAWNGTAWKLQVIHLPAGTLGSILYGVSCSTARCTAVGSYYGAAGLPVTLAIAAPAGR